MSVKEELRDAEQQKLRDWLPYAEQFGYRTMEDGQPGGHSRYEIRLPNMQHYSAVTALSDNLFRNIIQFNRDDMVLGYDVFGKAAQAERDILCTEGAAGELCNSDSSERQLLKQFFENEGSTLADDLEELIDREEDGDNMSVPFKIIVLSGFALVVIAYDRPQKLTRVVQDIVTLKDEYEAEKYADSKEKGDSDYESIASDDDDDDEHEEESQK